VGVWFERTMEKKANFTVDSNPRVADTDGDGSSDFDPHSPWRGRDRN
jgi:hypothetical protein